MSPTAQFYLKTCPLPGFPSSPYTNLYLRHHASGINSVVLTPGQPKFIKAHQDGNRVSFTSASHKDRRWGLTLRTDGGQRAGWERVEIVEDGGSEGFLFKSSESGDGDGDGNETESVLEYGGGWMVCEWAHGHPQLFWVTDQLKGELPEFCHRVRVVREML